MKKSVLFCALASLLLLCSCSDNENEYSLDYRCYFLFDAQVHNVSIIKNALNPLASGIFVYVSTERRNGVRYVLSEFCAEESPDSDRQSVYDHSNRHKRSPFIFDAFRNRAANFTSFIQLPDSGLFPE